MNVRAIRKRPKTENLLFSLLLLLMTSCTIPRQVDNPSRLQTWNNSTEISETADVSNLFFEENQGQTDDVVQYLARSKGYALFLTPTEAVLALRTTSASAQEGSAQDVSESAVLRMKLVAANPNPQLVGVDELVGKVNYFSGNDTANWRTNISTFAQVMYQDVYPGIDLLYYGTEGQLEYDFVIAPGMNPSDIVLDIRGAEKIQINPQGDLVLHTQVGEVVHRAPLAYQSISGLRQIVASRYKLLGDHQIGFTLGNYDTSKPLVIDPIVVYASYLGGNGFDQARDISVDAAGNAYVTGVTFSPDLPLMAPFQTDQLSVDAFVTKIAPSGALVYSTYLGGAGGDEGYAIAVDAAGNAYVMGHTRESTVTPNDFPTVNALIPVACSLFPDRDAFLTKLNASGSALIFSTFLCGTNNDLARDVVVDAAGNIYVAGVTMATDFPTTNPAQSASGGGFDGFIAKLNPAASAFLYATYLGGSLDDYLGGIAVDGAGNAYVTGTTNSTDFPTVVPFQGTKGGVNDFDVIMTKLDASGSSFVYSTYLGGSGDDFGLDLVVDTAGNAYVGGQTRSNNFPLQNALQPTRGGSIEGFITKFDITGANLAYSTYLGGSDSDEVGGIAIDSTNSVYVVGQTNSTNFPLANPAQAANGGLFDAFVTKLNATGSALEFSTYYGGSNDELGRRIGLDNAGNIYFTGDTLSGDLPTVNPFQPNYGGGGTYDAFVAQISTPCSTTVSNLNDSGAGSLRTAIACANADLGADTVTFAVSGTINIATQLPTLSDTTGGTLIDGTSAPGYSGTPIVVLDGPGTGSFVRGLQITSGNNEVRALQIGDFSWAIEIDGAAATGNAVVGNYLGNDGTSAVDAAVGVVIDDASNNLIGTNGDGVNDAAEGNVISGNSGLGVQISGGLATGNVVAGNRIGTDATGLLALPNLGQAGIQLINTDGNRIGSNGDGIGDLEERNVISANTGAGIQLTSGSDNNVIAGNYIGVDVVGSGALGNGVVNGSTRDGIAINSSSNNRIGTDGDGIGDTAERNVIGANNNVGISISGNSSQDNVIAGNYIGTDATGANAIGNTFGGIQISGSTRTLIGTNGDGIGDAAEGNLISGNLDGISLSNSATVDTVIAGNLIGTDATGTLDLGNTRNGIRIAASTANTLVGTDSDGVADSAERNIISGNDDRGLDIVGGTTETVVTGNFIGTDVTGLVDLGNTRNGIVVSDPAQIGTNSDGINDASEQNIISGNDENGISIGGAGVVVAGNIIGADVAGMGALGNNLNGVQIGFSATNNTVGGITSTAANLIAYNGTNGVRIVGSNSIQNSILHNSIVSNGLLGIDLSNSSSPDGVATINDTGDGDTGANDLQNFPVITAVISNTTDTTIEGMFNGASNTSINLQLFSNMTCDPSGFGEGETFLGSTVVATNGSGDATFFGHSSWACTCQWICDRHRHRL